MEEQQKNILFWSYDPNILFNTSYITEFFPIPNMSFEQKLNAVSRGVIVLSLFLFLTHYMHKIILIHWINYFKKGH